MTARVLLSVLLTVVSVTAPMTRASAGEASPTTTDLLEQAQVFVNKASQLYLQSNYDGALEQLRQAEVLALKAKAPSLANIRFNIARCYEQMERWAEALEAYQIYNGLPDEPHRKEKAWAAMQTLETKVFGALSVSCFPARAQVEIAGLTSGVVTCPWQSTKVKPGTYSVAVRNPGYESQTQNVVVVAGQAANAEATLKPLVSSVSAELATPAPAAETPKLPWLTIGVGVATAGVGAVFTGLALSDQDEAEGLPPGDERDDVVDSFEGQRSLSYIMYGTGGVLAVAGIVWLYLAGEDDAAPESISVLPTANGLRMEF
jgi:hypothetical protein